MGVFEASQSNLSSQKKVVEQTDEESGDDRDPLGSQRSPSPPPRTRDANKAVPSQEKNDERPEIGEQEKGNSMSTAHVSNEITNCQEQIKLVIKALEEIRRVRMIFVF